MRQEYNLNIPSGYKLGIPLRLKVKSGTPKIESPMFMNGFLVASSTFSPHEIIVLKVQENAKKVKELKIPNGVKINIINDSPIKESKLKNHKVKVFDPVKESYTNEFSFLFAIFVFGMIAVLSSYRGRIKRYYLERKTKKMILSYLYRADYLSIYALMISRPNSKFSEELDEFFNYFSGNCFKPIPRKEFISNCVRLIT